MKRLLFGIPLAAIALGLVLLLWRSFSSQNPEAAARTTEDPASAAATPADASRPAAGGRPPAPAPAPGSIHILVQSQGKGFPKAKIRITRELNHENMEVEADAQGFHTLISVPVGEYHIEGAMPHYIAKSVHTLVEPGKTSEVVLALELGARLEGRVFDPQGRPNPGAHLNLLNPDKGITMTPTLSAVSDAEGHYVIDGIPLLDLHLYVYHPRYKAWWKKDMPFRNPDFTVHQDVTMEEGCRLAGLVTDAEGRPVADAVLYATNEAIIVETSDAQGRFTILGLGTGPIRLKVQAKGYGTHYQQGLTPNSEGVQVRLARPGSLKGSLEAAPPPEHFQITLFRYDPALGQEQRLDVLNFSGTRGSFELPDLAPGRYRLGIGADGWEAQDLPEVYIQEGSANAPATIKMSRKK